MNVGLGPYIRPSMAHETINVPSRLKLTAVTGSEWAGRILRDLPVGLCGKTQGNGGTERDSHL